MTSYAQTALKIAVTACPIWVERQNGETGKGGKVFLFLPFHMPFYPFARFPLTKSSVGKRCAH